MGRAAAASRVQGWRLIFLLAAGFSALRWLRRTGRILQMQDGLQQTCLQVQPVRAQTKCNSEPSKVKVVPSSKLITRSIAFFRTNFTDWGSCTTGKPSGSSCAAQAASCSKYYVQDASVRFQ